MPAFFRPISSTRAALALARWAALASAICLALAAGPVLAWGLDDVAQRAQQQARQPFKPAVNNIPPELAALDYDQYRDIRFNEDSALWRAEQRPFEAQFFHVGRQADAVRLHEITPEGLAPLHYQPAQFNFGNNLLTPQSWGELGHGGLKALFNLNTAAHKDELIAFSGASYFRALGAGQRYGLSARGLAVDTAGGAPEEFPRFTEFWLEKPGADARQLTVYALLDSPRMTGAYRFDIQPGEQTETRVQARIFMRATDKPVTVLGLAPLSSMFFFGENQPRPGDFRPEVHDSDGLMIATGDGEWLWRPLHNPAATLVSSFSMARLKGFGLMQRDRAFPHFEDTEARYELRPSAWITPVGDWGPGRVELLQFATPDETHDNVAAYWVPAKLPAPGESLDFAYQIAWQGQQQQRPPLAWVTQSRRGAGYLKATQDPQKQPVQFVVDFAGPALDALPDDAPVQAVVSTSPNARVLESLVFKNLATGAWRMTLRVQTPQPMQPVELRAHLQHTHQTLSETWTNLITQ
jgi:glucans biosynthesis protein